MSDEVAELGRYAVQLAAGASAVVREMTGEAARPRVGAEVGSKSTSTDLVTEVDRASELWLAERIAADRPGDGVLGEEDGSRPGTTEVRWIVDPIDGTVNFVLGLPQYAVSVAAEVAGRVVAGAVCNPVTGELFHATLGGGAWLDRLNGEHDPQQLRGPRVVPVERAVVGTGFGYDSGQRAKQGRVAAELLPLVGDIRRLGSAALDLCAVAAGRIDAYFEAGLNLWDRAAGELIVTEAGGVVSGLRGRTPGALTAAAGSQLAGDFFALLERLGADRVL